MAMATAATTTAVTASTMSTRSGLSLFSPLAFIRGTSRRELNSLVLALVAGIALIGIAVPRAVGYVMIAPSVHVRDSIDGGRALERDALIEAYDDYGRAAGWLPGDATIHRYSALIAYRLQSQAGGAESENAAFGGGKLIAEAVVHLREAVSVAPGKSISWALLADAELKAGAAPGDVVEMLRLSWYTGLTRPSAGIVRSRVVFANWGDMPDDIRSHALSDFEGLWKIRDLRPRLLNIYIDSDLRARAAMRERLAQTPGALTAFDRLIRSILGAPKIRN